MLKRFKIKKVFQYTEDVEVDAESREEALELSNSTEGDVNEDDTLMDAKVISEDDIKSEEEMEKEGMEEMERLELMSGQ
jgi:hypothetical protein